MNSQDSRAMVTITISRPYDSHHIPKGIIVDLDGMEVARLQRGDSVAIEVEQGEHLLSATGLCLKKAEKRLSVSEDCFYFVCVDLYHLNQFQIATNGLFYWKLPIGIYDTEEEVFVNQKKREIPPFFLSRSYQAGILMLILAPGVFLFLTKCHTFVFFFILLIDLVPFFTIPKTKEFIKEGYLAVGLFLVAILFSSYLNLLQQIVIYADALILIGLQVTKAMVSKKAQ